MTANMQAPIMVLAGSLTGPSTAAVRHSGLVQGATAAWKSNSNGVKNPCPVAGSFSNLEAYFPVALTSNHTYTLALAKAGVATALTVTADSTSGRQSDLTHSVAVVEGDTVGLIITPANTPEAQTNIQAGVLFTSSEGGAAPIFGGSGTSGTATTFYSPFGSLRAAAAEVDSAVSCAAAGVIDKLYIVLDTAPTAGNSWTVTLYKNGSATALTCSIADAATTGSDTNAGHAVTVAAGDLLSVQFTAVTAPAAAVAAFGARFTPTTNGEYPLFALWSGNPTANADRFNNANGQSASQATEANIYNIVPYACTIKKMRLHVTTGPGGTTRTRSTWLRKGAIGGSQSDGTLTCVITDTAIDASDGSNSYDAAAGDLLDIRTNSSASATAPAQMTVGMVAYIAPPAAAASGGTGMMMGIG